MMGHHCCCQWNANYTASTAAAIATFTTTITTNNSNNNKNNVNPLWHKCNVHLCWNGWLWNSDSHVIRPKSQLAPRQCVIVDVMPVCSKAELKPGERKKGVAEESERQGHKNASLRWNKHGGVEPNRANDLKENERNGRKTWNKNQFTVNCAQRKRLKWKRE